MIGQGFNTVCPPVTIVPASVHASRKPRTIKFVEIVRSFFDMSRLAANSIRTKSHRSTPSAYRSDNTFAAPIRPCRYGESTNGKKKSVVLTTYWP